jgi:hypothetical protein
MGGFLAKLKSAFGGSDEKGPEVPEGTKVIQCEKGVVVDKGVGVTVKDRELMVSDPVSGSSGKQKVLQGRKAEDYADIRFDLKGAGPQDLTLFATKNYEGGTFRFYANGEQIGEDIDTFSKTVEPTGPIPLGTVTPELGCVTLRVEAVRANRLAKTGRVYLGLDTLQAVDAAE